jgi:hypothetical protein
VNTIKTCFLRALIYAGNGLAMVFYEPPSMEELMFMLAMWEIIIASCPWINTKQEK